jgi:aspartate kinase
MWAIYMNEIIITKFGGTSVADFACMSRCADFAKNISQPSVIVVSAIAKTTKLLLSLIQLNLSVQKRQEIIGMVREKHYAILNHLDDSSALKLDLEKHLKNIEETSLLLGNEINPLLIDRLLSCGEQMSSLLFVEILKNKNIPAVLFDARKAIKTDSNFGNAKPDIAKIKENVFKNLFPLCENNVVVTQGFIGADDNNNTTTLGFESSDYTATLLAEALGAKQVNIMTDVPGILTADPKIKLRTKTLNEISFREMSELARFGAKVLHPAALWPAIRNDIKVFVGSSKDPGCGTWIVNKTSGQPILRAITSRENQSLLTVSDYDLFHGHEFLVKAFEVFANHKVNVDLATTSDINISVILEADQITPKLLEELGGVGEIAVEKKFTLITLVGNNLHTTSGIGKKIFKTIGKNNIRVIAHGASSHNICFLVEKQSAEGLVKRLHKKLLR